MQPFCPLSTTCDGEGSSGGRDYEWRFADGDHASGETVDTLEWNMAISTPFDIDGAIWLNTAVRLCAIY